MITGKDFVFTGLQPWDLPIGSNARDIALEVSKYNRVLYINTPLDKKTYWGKQESPDITQRKKVIKGELPALRHIAPNLWILDYPFSIWSINFLPDGILYDFANKANNKKMYRFAAKIIEKLQFKNYYLFIDNDIYRSFHAKKYLNPLLSIYYRRDNMISSNKTSYWYKHASRLEPLLCSKSDLVLTNSSILANKVKNNNSNTYNIGQGVDLKNYNIEYENTVPSDMATIKRPIIGYVGWITAKRLDADLLYSIAKQRPDSSFVLVGNEDNVFIDHQLHSLTNVYFLGHKPQSETIRYMANFDVCINPQLINDTTEGNYPRKIDEYLALGKPVIATRTPAMDMFKDYVWNCIGTEEYLQAIDEAINEKNGCQIKERIRFAHSHSWENCVHEIYDHIKQIERSTC